MEKSPSGQNDAASGKSNGDGDQSANLVSYESHQKLLGEKKKIQSEFEALKSRIEDMENEKLQSQGKLKELNDSLSKQLNEQKAKERSLHKAYSERVIKQQFVAEATKNGCIDPEAAFRLCDLQGIEVTDDFSLNGDGLKSALSEMQKKNPYLFKKDVKPPKDQTPSNSINQSSHSDMSTDDMWKELGKLV